MISERLPFGGRSYPKGLARAAKSVAPDRRSSQPGFRHGAHSGQTTRNATIDYLRLAAAVGIVWFHSQAPGHWIAYLALPFFLVLLGMPSTASLQKRARRLLWPFLIWSGIYAGVRVVFALRSGEPPLGWWETGMLLAGTSVHLWFLPFAFMGTLVFRLIRPDWLVLVLPVLAAVVVVLAPEAGIAPFQQWLFGIVPLTLGFCYFRCGLRVILPWIVATAVLFVGRNSDDNLTIALGSALTLVLMQIRLPRSILSDWCARVAFLVFLDHMIVMQAGWTLSLQGLALATFAVTGALALSAGLDRLRGQRFVRFLT